MTNTYTKNHLQSLLQPTLLIHTCLVAESLDISIYPRFALIHSQFQCQIGCSFMLEKMIKNSIYIPKCNMQHTIRYAVCNSNEEKNSNPTSEVVRYVVFLTYSTNRTRSDAGLNRFPYWLGIVHLSKKIISIINICKDVEPFILENARECIWLKRTWKQTQILTEFEYQCWY